MKTCSTDGNHFKSHLSTGLQTLYLQATASNRFHPAKMKQKHTQMIGILPKNYISLWFLTWQIEKNLISLLARDKVKILLAVTRQKVFVARLMKNYAQMIFSHCFQQYNMS